MASTNVAALLANHLSTTADINFFTQQSIYWTNKQEGNVRKLERQQKYEAKWEKAYDEVMDYNKEDKDFKTATGEVVKASINDTERYDIADRHAHAKVGEYDEELLLECQELDVEYSTMVEMYNSMLELLKAQQETEKGALSEAAQNTGIIGQ